MVEPRLSQLLWLSQFAMCYCCCCTVRQAHGHIFAHEHATTQHLYFARAHRDQKQQSPFYITAKALQVQIYNFCSCSVVV